MGNQNEPGGSDRIGRVDVHSPTHWFLAPGFQRDLSAGLLLQWRLEVGYKGREFRFLMEKRLCIEMSPTQGG
jgi:hypothetical protein